MKKFISVTLIAAALFLAACTGAQAPPTFDTETHPTDTTSDEPTAASTVPEPEAPMLFGIPLEDYSIVYPRTGEPEVTRTAALELRDMLADCFGITLAMHNDVRKSEHEIVIGATTREKSKKLKEGLDTFDYIVTAENKTLYVAGGSSFALTAGFETMKEKFFDKGMLPDETIDITGSAYAKEIYHLTDGATIRLMSNNTWNCDTNRWQNIGEDCSAGARFRGLTAVYMAYHPDVICFQEMTAQMIKLIQREFFLQKYDGYSLLTYTDDPVTKPYTCIIYRSDRLELETQGHHDFAYGNDANSKGYTWGLFRIKDSGKRFIALSTHMWWKSESSQPGSDTWRINQAQEIVEKTRELEALYDCPIFVMGDFNMKVSSEAFAVYMRGGFADAFDAATLYADDVGGHHSCGPDGYSREDPVPTYKAGAIDHIIFRNPKDAEVLVFNHVRPYFFIKISDHYPLYVDVKY